MVVIPVHTLHICIHRNHDVSSVSIYEARKALGFLLPFAIAIRSCHGIAIDDRYDCIHMYYLYICT